MPDHVEAFDVTISVVILKVGSSSGQLVGQAFFFPLAAQVADLTACISLTSAMDQSFARSLPLRLLCSYVQGESRRCNYPINFQFYN